MTDGILDGITRDSIIALASDAGIPVEVRGVPGTELRTADEVFACGSAVEVRHVCSVNGLTVGEGSSGPVTSKVTRLYGDCVRGRLPAVRTLADARFRDCRLMNHPLRRDEAPIIPKRTLAAKRAFDIAAALALLVVSILPMSVVAVAGADRCGFANPVPPGTHRKGPQALQHDQVSNHGAGCAEPGDWLVQF